MLRSLCLALMCSALATPLAAAQPAAPAQIAQPATQDDLAYAADSARRMTVPVTVAGRGPFPFVVDTGAERTVISRELAGSLQLAASTEVTLISITDVQQVPTVTIPQLNFGRRYVGAIRAPILAEAHLGAPGLLGVDSLANQRVTFDFRARELRFSTAAQDREQWTRGTIVVRARTRLGRMVVSDAAVDGERVRVIVDTGSSVTIGNPALRDRLARRRATGEVQQLRVTSVTGHSVDIDYARTRHIRIGTGAITDLPIAFSDARLFRELGLEDRPALLLGMDALELFQRVAIDFANRRVEFMPVESNAGPPINMRMATRLPTAP